MNDTNVDHFDFLGIHLLRFNHFQRVLDPLDGGEFRGFTPRWTLPSKLRNPMNEDRRSTALMVTMDSKREVDLNMHPHFSQRVLARDEAMVSKNTLRYL